MHNPDDGIGSSARWSAAVLVAVGALVMLVLVGCGGKSHAPAAPAAQASPSVADVQAGLREQVSRGRLDQQVLDAVQTGGSAEGLLVLNEDLIDERIKELAAAQRITLTDQQIVQLKLQAYALAKSQVLALSPGAGVLDDYKSFGVVHVRFPSARALLTVLSRPEVAGVRANQAYQPARVAEADPRAPLAADLALIHQGDAAAAGFTGAGTSVAVLDSGADYRRDAFGPCDSPGQPADRCRVAVFQHIGADDSLLDSDTQHMHGTNVAGIVAAVAPQSTLIVFDIQDNARGGIYDSSALQALDWVVQHQQQYHIAATNLSFGNSTDFNVSSCASPYASAFNQLRSAGVVPVTSAGNSAYNSNTHEFRNGVGRIACTPGAVNVGAVYFANVGGADYQDCKDTTTQPDQIACFSQSGPLLSVLAPGVDVTAAGVTESGTSQATPHVTGAVAALASKCTAASPDQIEKALETSGPAITDNRNGITRHRLDLAAAAQTLVASGACTTDGGGSQPPPPRTQPTGGQGVSAALLGAPVTSRELPKGFSSPDVHAGNLSDLANKYNATGQVDVTTKGPDAGDAISYILFGNNADAKSFFQATVGTPAFTLAGVGAPAGCVTGPFTLSSGQQVGVTACYALDGAVVVRSITISDQQASHGDDKAAVSLLKFGRSHLKKVESAKPSSASRPSR